MSPVSEQSAHDLPQDAASTAALLRPTLGGSISGGVGESLGDLLEAGIADSRL